MLDPTGGNHRQRQRRWMTGWKTLEATDGATSTSPSRRHREALPAVYLSSSVIVASIDKELVGTGTLLELGQLADMRKGEGLPRKKV
uniref:Uncharacterized protein n=1 Tax=Oryza sativa subsp. japonica TaxID=39947 RepID=Q6ZKB6_ORYSJ|nr:hypothetical protein [Oryza sativa Japonica Group]BAD01174.1 hypothetical protein [Oryza sativa Japonica Group]